MIIKNYKKFNVRRKYVMAKLNKSISIENMLIDEIENSSTNDWDELCDTCFSLVKEANMTDKDIDEIVKKVRNGTR